MAKATCTKQGKDCVKLEYSPEQVNDLIETKEQMHASVSY